MLEVVKAHAFGNDFLFVGENCIRPDDAPLVARRLCDRHAGIGGDGLVLHAPTPRGASFRLLNADGSPSELSGNGVRCLAAIVAHSDPSAREGTVIEIDSDAGVKALTLIARDKSRILFRAAMGHPTDIGRVALENVGGEQLNAVVLRVGNPQCVILGGTLTEERMHRLGPAIENHSYFPARTNVEFAVVDDPGHVRILIWERGVGPTLSSGTGSCAAAVAAATYGGASRDVEVIAPGGRQRVEWTSEGLFLTGWAEVLFRAQWLA
ncbi:MAG: diaminopimelate epimerase [Vicinamibacterales bacterium]